MFFEPKLLFIWQKCRDLTSVFLLISAVKFLLRIFFRFSSWKRFVLRKFFKKNNKKSFLIFFMAENCFSMWGYFENYIILQYHTHKLTKSHNFNENNIINACHCSPFSCFSTRFDDGKVFISFITITKLVFILLENAVYASFVGTTDKHVLMKTNILAGAGKAREISLQVKLELSAKWCESRRNFVVSCERRFFHRFVHLNILELPNYLAIMLICIFIGKVFNSKVCHSCTRPLYKAESRSANVCNLKGLKKFQSTNV